MKDFILNHKIGKYILLLLKPFFIYGKKERKWYTLYETNFAKTYSKDALLRKSKRNDAKFMLIDKGVYIYAYFNFTLLNNLLSSIIAVLAQGKFPIVDLGKRQENWVNWSTFFAQPFGHTLKDFNQEKQKMIFEKTSGNVFPGFTDHFTEERLQICCKLYRDFVVLNAETQQYVDNEFDTLLKGKRVLGVLCRGTDYVQSHPYGHPVQPETTDVIALAKEKMAALGLDYIYLATEEKRIESQFKEAFPNKIIVNKRTYFDDAFYSQQKTSIYQVFDTSSVSIHIDGLQYLSSICLLSKCDALIGGNCGGSAAALYMNNMKYEYWHLFDLGLYGK
jgi:hypothetical protein